MFQTVPLSIIRSFTLYIQDSILIPLASCQQNLYDIYDCCMYSVKLLTMGRGTVRNM